jgi:hypothetical protein
VLLSPQPQSVDVRALSHLRERSIHFVALARTPLVLVRKIYFIPEGEEQFWKESSERVEKLKAADEVG